VCEGENDSDGSVMFTQIGRPCQQRTDERTSRLRRPETMRITL